MQATTIKLASITLVGLIILSTMAYFLFFYQKYRTKPEALNEPTQAVSAPNGANPENSNLNEVGVDIPAANNASTPETEPVVAGKSRISVQSSYPLHTNITATVFWVGEPVGGGSSENNALSAWDDSWQKHYGCFDDPFNRNGYYPKGCVPKENPFYFDLPYDDFDWDRADGRRANAYQVVPWAKSKKWQEEESMLKNRWIKITNGTTVCYGQWEDSGPYVYDDASYVFSKNNERPKSKEANNAGMDVSPALRDCLKFQGLNNDTNKVSWQFIESKDVPAGPWKNIVTASGTYWK